MFEEIVGNYHNLFVEIKIFLSVSFTEQNVTIRTDSFPI